VRGLPELRRSLLSSRAMEDGQIQAWVWISRPRSLTGHRLEGFAHGFIPSQFWRPAVFMEVSQSHDQ
jgi:hypothetical protein